MSASVPIYTSTTVTTPSAEREPFTLILSRSDHRNRKSTTERTLVFQQDDNDQIFLIACLDFHDFGDWKEDTIIYRDKRSPLACYLPRRSKSHCRCMLTSSGEWAWTKSFGGGLKLRNALKGRMAKYHRRLFSFPPAKPTIEIDEDALPHLDAIIIGWIVVSRDIELDRVSGNDGVFPVG